jgi:ribonucleoside-diphosphate reductase alpha chain
VEVPKSWSQLATKVVVSKYFYGEQNTAERETSVKQLIHRITRTIADWGVKDGYFSKADGEVFYEELTWLCLNQYGAFNSPVWFNVGLHHEYGVGKDSCKGNWFYNRKAGEAERASSQYVYPQCSACFIQSVEDNMESIMKLAHSEAMLFKFGSGTGTDLTPIRSAREKLSGGGRPSGPLSFLKVYDQVANVVKSGGKTRRAAKMNTLRDWHGDIEEFIECKMKEERKAWALIEQGYDGSYNGDAYGSVMYQNENLSVRVSDEFMQAALEGREWWTRSITSGVGNGGRDPSPVATGWRRRTQPSCLPRSPKARGFAAILVCNTTAPSSNGTPARAPSQSTPPIPAANTSSPTTPPATSPRSTS